MVSGYYSLSEMSKLTYRFNAIPIKEILEIGKYILKFKWKGKWARIVKTVLRKKKKKRTNLHYLILTIILTILQLL